MKKSIELSDDYFSDLRLLGHDLSIDDKDLFNNALTILEWAVSEIKQGRTIGSTILGKCNDSNFSELSMSVFENIKVI